MEPRRGSMWEYYLYVTYVFIGGCLPELSAMN